LKQMVQNMTSVQTRFENKLSDIFACKLIDQEKIFVREDGVCFKLSVAYSKHNNWAALLTEYADNYEEMKNDNTEDGDMLFIEDFSSEDQMFNLLLEEIRM